jgi:hypothetical protein
LCKKDLVYNWVKTNYKDSTTIIKKNKLKFMISNFTSKVPIWLRVLCFSTQIEQIYYIDAHEEHGWRIVLRQEVRGRHINGEDGMAEAEGLIAME